MKKQPDRRERTATSLFGRRHKRLPQRPLLVQQGPLRQILYSARIKRDRASEPYMALYLYITTGHYIGDVVSRLLFSGKNDPKAYDGDTHDHRKRVTKITIYRGKTVTYKNE